MTDSSLGFGALVVYEQDGESIPAIVMGYDRSKYMLFSVRGRQVELTADRLHKLPHAGETKTLTSSEVRLKYLQKLDHDARAWAAEINLHPIWEKASAENREFSNAELTALLLGKDELLGHLAVRFALLADKVHFKRKKELFVPRSLAQMEELQKTEEQRRKRLEALTELQEHFAARLKDRAQPAAALIEPELYLLKQIAADAPHLDNQQRRDAKDVLKQFCERHQIEQQGTLPERAYDLLERTGYFQERGTNLAFFRYLPFGNFSAAAQAEAEAVDPAAPAPFARVDFSAKHCITIDDASTRDMDDALSIEQTEDGYLLGIHISDVATAIAQDGPLDLEARGRATSIYTGDCTRHMLPNVLAEDRLSLTQGQVRPALSFLIEIDRSYAVKNFQLKPSIIKVRERLTYEEADRRLESGDSSLSLLYNITAELEARRFEQGGFRVEKRDAAVQVAPDGELILVEIDENAPSRALVAELMVLTNRVLAQYTTENKIPIPYRSQPEPDRDKISRISSIPAGPARDYAVRGTLKKSTVSFVPDRHATLGIVGYTQATSPIRRYLDLCIQRQVLHYLRTGVPLFTEEQFAKLVTETEEPLRKATAVSRESKRFWLLTYLGQMSRSGAALAGTVVRNDLNTPLMELDHIYTVCFAQTRKKPALGDKFNLRLVSVDPRYDSVRLEEI